MSMIIEVNLEQDKIDDIIIEQLTLELDSLHASGLPEDKEYISAFEKVIDWHGG